MVVVVAKRLRSSATHGETRSGRGWGVGEMGETCSMLHCKSRAELEQGPGLQTVEPGSTKGAFFQSHGVSHPLLLSPAPVEGPICKGTCCAIPNSHPHHGVGLPHTHVHLSSGPSAPTLKSSLGGHRKSSESGDGDSLLLWGP